MSKRDFNISPHRNMVNNVLEKPCLQYLNLKKVVDVKVNNNKMIQLVE